MHPQLQLAQLCSQLRVHIGIFFRERPRIGPDERRSGTGRGVCRTRARPNSLRF